MKKYILLIALFLSLAAQGQLLGVVASQGDTGGVVNLCENGTFDGNSTTGWGLSTGYSVANDRLEATSTTALATYTFPSHTLVPGDTYRVEFYLSVTTGGVRIRLGGSSPLATATTTGNHSFDVVAESSGNYLRFDDNLGAWTGYIDNIVVTKL